MNVYIFYILRFLSIIERLYSFQYDQYWLRYEFFEKILRRMESSAYEK